MEHKINEIITLKVIESTDSDCIDCFFYNLDGCADIVCEKQKRHDNTSIKYIRTD